MICQSPTEYLDSISVKCPKCGLRLGKYQPMPNNETWLKVGDLVLSELHGFCKCGAEFHFVYLTKTLDDLIKKVRVNQTRT